MCNSRKETRQSLPGGVTGDDQNRKFTSNHAAGPRSNFQAFYLRAKSFNPILKHFCCLICREPNALAHWSRGRGRVERCARSNGLTAALLCFENIEEVRTKVGVFTSKPAQKIGFWSLFHLLLPVLNLDSRLQRKYPLLTGNRDATIGWIAHISPALPKILFTFTLAWTLVCFERVSVHLHNCKCNFMPNPAPTDGWVNERHWSWASGRYSEVRFVCKHFIYSALKIKYFNMCE